MKKIVKPAAKKAAAPKVDKTAVVPKAEVKTAVVKEAKTKTQRVTFSVRAQEGSKVFIAGSFNDWDPTAKQLVDKKGDGLFVATLNLEPGSHQYKFVIDGIWCADPECTDWVHNDHGTLNSVKNVE